MPFITRCAVVETYVVYLLANSSNEKYHDIAVIIDNISLGAFPGMYVLSNGALYLGMYYRWKQARKINNFLLFSERRTFLTLSRTPQRPDIKFFDQKTLFQGRQSTEERLEHQKQIIAAANK